MAVDEESISTDSAMESFAQLGETSFQGIWETAVIDDRRGIIHLG